MVVEAEKPGLPASFRRIIVALVCAVAAFAPTRAKATSLGGYVDLSYAKVEARSTDPSGVTTSGNTNQFTQRYNLTLTDQIYPLVLLNAGVIFSHVNTDSESGGATFESSASSISPSASLVWGDRMFPLNLGYQRHEDSSEANGVQAPTQVLESYTAALGWNPLDLPPWSFTFQRLNSFDEHRISRNNTSDTFQWNTSFSPTPTVACNYQGAANWTSDKITLLDTSSLSNTGRIAYADQFLQNKVSLGTSYTLSLTDTTIESGTGRGLITTPVQATNGLSGVTSPTSPVRVDFGQLVATPSLLNASARINIVSPTPVSPGTQYNFGLDFGRPIPVNLLFLPVVSVGPTTVFLRPTDISRFAQLFIWTIYTSDDGITWTQVQGTVASRFGNDPTGLTDTVGFILPTPTLTQRFVKAVVNPVTQSAIQAFQPFSTMVPDGSNISVTAVQAYLQQSVQSFGNNLSSTSGSFALGARARLLEIPHVDYEMSFTLTHDQNSATNTGTLVSYYLSNGLAASHTFSKVFSGFARLSLDTNKSAASTVSNNLRLSILLNAVPLPTLSSSLSVTSQAGLGGGNASSSNSVFLTNTAQLYHGVSLAVSGGYSNSATADRRKGESWLLNVGLSLVPTKTCTVTFAYGATLSSATATTSASTRSETQTFSATLSYKPFETVYLSGALTETLQANQPNYTTQTYGVSWSPLLSGVILFNAQYGESYSTPDETRTRSVTPTVRWNVRPGTTLDATYSYSTSSAPLTADTETNTFLTTFRVIF